MSGRFPSPPQAASTARPRRAPLDAPGPDRAAWSGNHGPARPSSTPPLPPRGRGCSAALPPAAPGPRLPPAAPPPPPAPTAAEEPHLHRAHRSLRSAPLRMRRPPSPGRPASPAPPAQGVAVTPETEPAAEGHAIAAGGRGPPPRSQWGGAPQAPGRSWPRPPPAGRGGLCEGGGCGKLRLGEVLKGEAESF